VRAKVRGKHEAALPPLFLPQALMFNTREREGKIYIGKDGKIIMGGSRNESFHNTFK